MAVNNLEAQANHLAGYLLLLVSVKSDKKGLLFFCQWKVDWNRTKYELGNFLEFFLFLQILQFSSTFAIFSSFSYKYILF